LLLLFHLVLFRQTASKDTAGHGADDGVMTRIMTGNAADDCALDAAFRIGLRGSECKREGYGRQDRKCSHVT
jgi:hypothetical protein